MNSIMIRYAKTFSGPSNLVPITNAPVNITFLFAGVDIEGPVPVAHKAFEAAGDVFFEYVALKGNHEDIVKIGSPEDYCFKPIVDRLNKWIAPPVLLKNALKTTLHKPTTSFQTGRSTEYAGNNHHRHRDCITRQPEPQPSLSPRWAYEIFEPPLVPESASPPASFFIPRPCYVFCFLMFLVIGGSASLGIYYSVRYDKMGDGFTAAGWIVAIGALILAGPLARHYPHCSCWVTDKPLDFFELDRIETPPSRDPLSFVARD
ncbi:hypothetical protein EDB82DRAFT_355502 [Fusarium venenatum]|uniref:uncharacterized protein n=1 Tax=Fusarium venenatum TaxID=56646 RepID=UPI001D535CA1|nr:hypothetical protein EDB82DRAFT_355502 [Fusarium venenatum]